VSASLMLTPLFTNFIFPSPTITRLNRKKDRNRVSAANPTPDYMAQPFFENRVLPQRNLLVSFLMVGRIGFELMEFLQDKNTTMFSLIQEKHERKESFTFIDAVSGALEAEMDDADLIHLPRLVIDFNRRYFGRLRNLIDAINDF